MIGLQWLIVAAGLAFFVSGFFIRKRFMLQIQARRVTGDEDLKSPGDYQFFTDQQGNICGLSYVCPCGCGSESALIFHPYPKYRPDEARWTWDGNEQSPTLRPSILRTRGCGWHGYLTVGVFESC